MRASLWLCAVSSQTLKHKTYRLRVSSSCEVLSFVVNLIFYKWEHQRRWAIPQELCMCMLPRCTYSARSTEIYCSLTDVCLKDKITTHKLKAYVVSSWNGFCFILPLFRWPTVYTAPSTNYIKGKSHHPNVVVFWWRQWRWSVTAIQCGKDRVLREPRNGACDSLGGGWGKESSWNVLDHGMRKAIQAK